MMSEESDGKGVYYLAAFDDDGGVKLEGKLGSQKGQSVDICT
jgi:hypothetical protein